MTTSEIDNFKQDGYAVIAPGDHMEEWLHVAREEANRLMPDQPPASCWFSSHEFTTQLPRNTALENLLSDLLHSSGAGLQKNQLSVLFPGFQGTRQHRHVDGAEGGIFWHALLVGVLLDDLPHGQTGYGHPLVWPGSQRDTLAVFEGLGRNPAQKRLKDAIHEMTDRTTGNGTPIFGLAGTIFVMDHALVHGMADHTTLDFKRRIAYYRIGERTEDPAQVVDRQHFFKSSV